MDDNSDYFSGFGRRGRRKSARKLPKKTNNLKKNRSRSRRIAPRKVATRPNPLIFNPRGLGNDYF